MLKIKKSWLVIIIILAISISGIIGYQYYITTYLPPKRNTYRAYNSMALIIRKCIIYYITETGDKKLEKLNFIDGSRMDLISGKTKSKDLISALKKQINFSDKNNNLEILDPIIEEDKDFTFDNEFFTGYKIDIYYKDIKVIVQPCKKESDCIVTIY